MNQPDPPLEANHYAIRLLLGLISRMRRRDTDTDAGPASPQAHPAALPVTALTRKTAIIEIFRQVRTGQLDAQLLLTELMAAWPQTGLRAADLAIGLNEMLEEGSLRLAPQHHPASVALSESGKQWLHGINQDPQQRAEQLQILRAARQRQDNQPPEDHPPGELPQWRIVDRRVTLE